MDFTAISLRGRRSVVLKLDALIFEKWKKNRKMVIPPEFGYELVVKLCVDGLVLQKFPI